MREKVESYWPAIDFVLRQIFM